MLRFLNMFNLIGLALIAVSLIGFATNNHFLTEPGQQPSPTASLTYLGAGVLMLINGMVSLRAVPAHPPKDGPPTEKPKGDGNVEVADTTASQASA